MFTTNSGKGWYQHPF